MYSKFAFHNLNHFSYFVLPYILTKIIRQIFIKRGLFNSKRMLHRKVILTLFTWDNQYALESYICQMKSNYSNILSYQNGEFIHHTFDNNVTGLLNNLTMPFLYIQSNDTIINTISDTRYY